MPSGSEKRQRPYQSLIRWTEEEWANVSGKADKAGLAVAAFARAATLGDPGPRAQRRPPADHKVLRQLLGEAGRIGNNVNQIARAMNSGERASIPNTQDAINACLDIRNAIYEALGKNPGPGP